MTLPTGQSTASIASAVGATLLPEGGVLFRLWAPGCPRVRLLISTTTNHDPADLLEMQSTGDGFHELLVRSATAGTLYEFVLPDGTRVPDPASRFQPEDVHGPSEVIDPTAFGWTDGGWRGRPWHEAVIYELHIGTFTLSGTFCAATERLDHLSNLGVTAIEIMPVADFPGRYNWGYDGALLYAPDSVYGRPEDFKRFVDAAHARGLMVLLDVVYNHFGPDGNFIPSYAPGYFTDRHKTPWGAAVNYDGPHSLPVREFVVENALYWIRDFHLDGLRLDAVHAIIDDSATHLLDELSKRARASTSRTIHLILENEENEASLLARDTRGTANNFTAQWNDDAHHVLHVAATGERQGYYRDYQGDTPLLAKALAEGFAFQGQHMPYSGKKRGEPSAHLPPPAFIAFLQNHDQIGNRAFGDRLNNGLDERTVRALSSIVLLLPQTPMLFMGEEYGARQPFPFFCDFAGDLGKAIQQGRRQEFSKFPEFSDDAQRDRIPDPLALATFASAKLEWSDVDRPDGVRWLQFYRALLSLRRDRIRPWLPTITHGARWAVLGEGAIALRWQSNTGELALHANLSATHCEGFCELNNSPLWREGTVDAIGTASPWFVNWSLTPR